VLGVVPQLLAHRTDRPVLGELTTPRTVTDRGADQSNGVGHDASVTVPGIARRPFSTGSRPSRALEFVAAVRAFAAG
jgi:hypothetical protein